MHFNYTQSLLSLRDLESDSVVHIEANKKMEYELENKKHPPKSIWCVVLVSKCLSNIGILGDKLWFEEIGKYLQPQVKRACVHISHKHIG